MKMRTITEAYSEIKAQDENTCLTKFALKMLVKSNVIPSVSIGRKRLLNMAVLEEYLKGNTAPQANNVVEYGTIRKVSGV